MERIVHEDCYIFLDWLPSHRLYYGWTLFLGNAVDTALRRYRQQFLVFSFFSWWTVGCLSERNSSEQQQKLCLFQSFLCHIGPLQTYRNLGPDNREAFYVQSLPVAIVVQLIHLLARISSVLCRPGRRGRLYFSASLDCFPRVMQIRAPLPSFGKKETAYLLRSFFFFLVAHLRRKPQDVYTYLHISVGSGQTELLISFWPGHRSASVSKRLIL